VILTTLVRVLVCTTILAASLLFVRGSGAAPTAPILTGIHQARADTHRCQTELGASPSPIADRIPRGHAYRQWVLNLWKHRATSACATLERAQADPVTAIGIVFGRYTQQALRVAHCESRYDVNARNGQYLGLFQMGSYERATYGHGSTPLAQARAAYRYFSATRYTWGPWQCKPWN
jgi:hypothetical protein